MLCIKAGIWILGIPIDRSLDTHTHKLTSNEFIFCSIFVSLFRSGEFDFVSKAVASEGGNSMLAVGLSCEGNDDWVPVFSMTSRSVIIRYTIEHAVCYSIIYGLPEQNTSVYDSIGPVIPAVRVGVDIDSYLLDG